MKRHSGIFFENRIVPSVPLPLSEWRELSGYFYWNNIPVFFIRIEKMKARLQRAAGLSEARASFRFGSNFTKVWTETMAPVREV